jgi:ABC-type phosphate transport system ATPase subunit
MLPWGLFLNVAGLLLVLRCAVWVARTLAVQPPLFLCGEPVPSLQTFSVSVLEKNIAWLTAERT